MENVETLITSKYLAISDVSEQNKYYMNTPYKNYDLVDLVITLSFPKGCCVQTYSLI